MIDPGVQLTMIFAVVKSLWPIKIYITLEDPSPLRSDSPIRIVTDPSHREHRGSGSRARGDGDRAQLMEV